MNMRQLHILFDSAKTWHVIVCWFLCFAPNLPELNPKLFCSDVQNNFRLSSGKFGAKHRNQQTITCQVLAELNKLWSCLIFIKPYILPSQSFKCFFLIFSAYQKGLGFSKFCAKFGQRWQSNWTHVCCWWICWVCNSTRIAQIWIWIQNECYHTSGSYLQEFFL